MRRQLLIAPLLSLAMAASASAQNTTITDDIINLFLKGRAAEKPELEKVATQIDELDEKLSKFRECYKLVAGADEATGKKLGGLAGKAMLKAKCGATGEDGFLKDKAKLLEKPEQVAAAAAGLKQKDYSKLKELFTLYLGGSRNFAEGELKVLAARGADLSNGLGLALLKASDTGSSSGRGSSVGGRVANAMGLNMRAFTPDMTWAYVGYLWGLMYMSGATMFEQPYKPGQWTTWEITDTEQPDTKLVLERALISREADKSEWWRIKTISVTRESADTIILESQFKPLDEQGLTSQVVRMRGKLPGDTEGKELMVPQHLSMLSMSAFPMKPTAESVAGATVGTESIKAGSTSYSAKHVKFGSAGGSMNWWLADNAPGGVVKVEFAGQDNQKWVMQMTGSGTGAKSVLGVK